MPGLVTNRSVQSPSIQTPTAPPVSRTEPSADQVRENAVSEMAAIRRPRTRRSMSAEQAMTRIATAFERGQDRGNALAEVRRELASNPQVMRALSGVDSDTLLDTLRDKVGYLDGGSLTEEISDQIRARLVDTVRNDALGRVDQQIQTLQRARTQLIAKMSNMSDADQARAQTLIDTFDRGIEGYRGLKARMHGNAWEVSDFPAATRRAMAANGFADEGIASEIAGERDHSATIAHYTEAGVDVVLAGFEAHHAAHLFGAASGAAILSVAALGLLAGWAIHHAAEEVRQYDITLGHHLGL